MKVGFTGTRHGCTNDQRRLLEYVLHSISDMREFHHGDCVGADAEAHRLVPVCVPIYVHPTDVGLRAFCRGAAQVYSPLPPLVRNRIIVDCTDVLVACPASLEEELRSGTWSTVRYARRKSKKIILIRPDGLMELEETL